MFHSFYTINSTVDDVYISAMLDKTFQRTALKTLPIFIEGIKTPWAFIKDSMNYIVRDSRGQNYTISQFSEILSKISEVEYIKYGEMFPLEETESNNLTRKFHFIKETGCVVFDTYFRKLFEEDKNYIDLLDIDTYLSQLSIYNIRLRGRSNHYSIIENFIKTFNYLYIVADRFNDVLSDKTYTAYVQLEHIDDILYTASTPCIGCVSNSDDLEQSTAVVLPITNAILDIEKGQLLKFAQNSKANLLSSINSTTGVLPSWAAYYYVCKYSETIHKDFNIYYYLYDGNIYITTTVNTDTIQDLTPINKYIQEYFTVINNNTIDLKMITSGAPVNNLLSSRLIQYRR